MPATPTAASAQRAIHTRRSRLRRGAPRSATAEGTRSSGDCEDRSEESEATAGLVSNNRFAVLRPEEPVPSTHRKEGPAFLPQDSSFRRERPITPSVPIHALPPAQPDSSGEVKDKSLRPTPPTINYTKRSTIPRLAPHTPINSTRPESDQQPAAPVVASMPPIKPQAQISPLALQVEARSPKRPSAFARISPDFDRADPSLSLLAPHLGTSRPSLPLPPSLPDPMSEPSLASLPIPPIPQNPMSDPCLATLPMHPALDFHSITSPKFAHPKSRRITPPKPTRSDSFNSDDPMRHVVGTESGRLFAIAAEIAAADQKCMMRPVGPILMSELVSTLGGVKGKIDRKKADHESELCVKSSEEMEHGSEEEDEGDGEAEGEGWLGQDEDFWKQPFEKKWVVRSRSQRRKDKSP